MNLRLVYNELKEVFEKLGYKIVLDKGSFNTGDCLIEKEKIVVVNRNKPYENRIKILATILSKVNTDDIYLKPKIREMIISHSK
jgi:signal recognition particle subunit SEC65